MSAWLASWPGSVFTVFTGHLLHLTAGYFGLGHGSGTLARDQYYLIESENPKIQGMAGLCAQMPSRVSPRLSRSLRSWWR